MEDVQLSLSKKALEQLFSSETLAEEYKMLEQDWNLSQSCKVIPIPHLLNQIALNDSLNNFISSYLFYSPLNDNSAFLSLACLQSVVQQYPTLIKADQHLETLSRTGPALASALVKAYKEKQLESQFPAFVSLINHIVWYIEFKQNAPKPPRKKPRLDTTVTDVVLPSTGSAGLDHPIGPPNLQQLPSDLYGLKEPEKRSTIPMPTLSGKVVRGPQFLHDAIHQVFSDLISREFILTTMTSTDNSWNSSKRRTGKLPVSTKPKSKPAPQRGATQLKKFEARLVVRRAVLKCIADICGTEAIFAAKQLHPILKSHTAMFNENLSADVRFMSANPTG
ncbi:hypothetical protein B0H10DRAFT_1939703 [Mycena sp. CBHHK59/15]|nr:hypothetical protein B0H10DRAFT_1939703 [Mycena sp. CBHHK59/15]